MLPIHLALISQTPRVMMDDLVHAAAALQKQIIRDFSPIWGVRATISAFPDGHCPAGYWPLIVLDTIPHPGVGFHLFRGKPYALVPAGPAWSLAASHEMLEMLADPSGARLIAGPSPDPAQGRVEFLVSICDPCADVQYAYAINGIAVADFVTPNFFDPVASPQVRYSFSGAIRAPRQVLRNSRLNWFTQDGQLWQASGDTAGMVRIIARGKDDNPGGLPLREYADGHTPDHHARLAQAAIPAELIEAADAARIAGNVFAARITRELLHRFGIVPR